MKKAAERRDAQHLYDVRFGTFLCLLTVAVYIISSSLAYAGGGGTPMAEALCTVLDWLQGNLGVGLAVVAIASIGIAAIIGKASWGMVMTVAVGIAVLFGAGDLVDSFGIGQASCS